MSQLLQKIANNKKLFKPVIYGLKGPKLNDEEKYFFSKNSCIGFILFSRNIVDKIQLKNLTDSLREMCKNYPFFYKKNMQKRFDCGSVLGYLEANLAFALNDDNINQEVKNIIKKYQE